MNLENPSASARDGLSSVTVGTLLMLVGTLGYVGQQFFARVILARTLSPVEWGQFSLGLALAGLLSTLGTLGLPQAIARSLPFAQTDSERRSIVRSSFLVTLVSATVVSLALFLFGLYLGIAYVPGTLSLTLEIFAAAVGLSILSSLIASIFQGYEDVVPNALFLQLINPALFILALLLAIRFGPKGSIFEGALVAYLGSALITLFALSVYSRQRLSRRLPSGIRASGAARKLFLFAAPLFAVSLLGFLTGNADTLLVGVYHQLDVGYYTAALSLARLVLVGVGALSYIYLPVAARFVRQGDRAAVRLTYATATKWMLLTSLPLFLVFLFFPARSLGLVYGSLYSSSTSSLQVLVVGAFISSLAGPAAAAQVSFGQTRLLLYNALASSVVDVALGLALIPPLGIVGAAIAWSASNALNPILSTIELAVFSGVHPFRSHYVVPLVATAVPFFGLFLTLSLSPPLWALPVLVLGIAGSFILVVFLTGSLDRGDRLVLEVVEGMVGHPLTSLRRLGNWRIRHRLRESD